MRSNTETIREQLSVEQVEAIRRDYVAKGCKVNVYRYLSGMVQIEITHPNYSNTPKAKLPARN